MDAAGKMWEQPEGMALLETNSGLPDSHSLAGSMQVASKMSQTVFVGIVSGKQTKRGSVVFQGSAVAAM